MATTEVDVTNLALARLGDGATVSALDEGSAQADHAARFYPIARDSLLEMHAWKFATRRATLTLRADLSFSAWRYVYQEPNNLLKALGVLRDGYTDDNRDRVAFITEVDEDGAGLVLTNEPSAVLLGVYRITDPARFTPLFTEALSWMLASYLAGPLVKGESGRQEAIRCWSAFRIAFAEATRSSASQQRLVLPHIPAHLAGRSLATADDLPEVIRG